MALLFANLPFINEKFFSFFQLPSLSSKPSKSFWLRLLELAIYYFLLGSIAFYLESNAGNRFEQKWEFFAITVCLFIVFAFPGFVYRYLLKRTN
jgi:hypothetical protein